MGRGGARAGAGRKKKAQTFVSVIAAAERRIADRLPQLIDNMMVLADGVTIQEVDSDGGLNIYTRAPDRRANEYLINRILGTPTQRLDLDTDPDGMLNITAQAMDTAARELAEWRKQMTGQLSSLNAPPTPPTPATPTA
jgi:hypothetical protein